MTGTHCTRKWVASIKGYLRYSSIHSNYKKNYREYNYVVIFPENNSECEGLNQTEHTVMVSQDSSGHMT